MRCYSGASTGAGRGRGHVLVLLLCAPWAAHGLRREASATAAALEDRGEAGARFSPRSIIAGALTAILPQQYRRWADPTVDWPEEWRNELQGVRVIVRGTDNTIYLASSSAGEAALGARKVVVKEICAADPEQEEAARREIWALERFRGQPEFVQSDGIAAVEQSEPPSMLVRMELARGDLQQAVVERFRRISKETKMRLLIDALIGLAKMEEDGFVHGDVCPSNLLIFGGRDQSKWRAKLGDFGNSCAFRDFDRQVVKCRGIRGSVYYMAPEAVDPDPVWGPKRDVWSLGITLYAMLFGRVPPRVQELFDYYFTTDDLVTQLDFWHLLRDKFKIREDENFHRLVEEDPKLAGLLAGMLETTAFERLSAVQALQLAGIIDIDVRRRAARDGKRPFWQRAPGRARRAQSV